jgi:stage II sporulation protein D
VKRSILLLALGAAPLAASASGGGEVQQTADAAVASFLQGRFEDAVGAFRYLASLGITAPDPETNLAVLHRDMGQTEAALPFWVKASLRQESDGFSWNQRGWSYLSLDRPQEARESFLRALDRSSTTATQAEAQLGLGMAGLMNGQPKTAMAPLRSALVLGPYVLPLAAYQTALTALAVGDKNAAQAYLRQCASQDAFNLECLRELARLHARMGENRPAWRVYQRILSLDALDVESARQAEKLAAYITGNPEDHKPIRRLSRPLLNPNEADLPIPGSSVTLRVALFSDGDGNPATATQAYLVVNSDFKVLAGRDVMRDSGRAQDQWEVLFRPENNVVELRDNARNIQHISKQPFLLLPSERRGSVLIKSARFTDSRGIDPGDREVRGAVEVVPTPYGFKLVNEVNLEDYVYGAVASALPQGSPLQAYRAQAVVARTRALWYKANRPENLERSDLCDSAACQRYVGLSEEMRTSTREAAATEGFVLTLAGRPARLMQHENCGGATEDGRQSGRPGLEHLASVQDAENPSVAQRAPELLERWTHEFPARERYCEASGLTPPAQSRWMRLLSGKELQERMDRLKTVGKIKRIRAARRSTSGRIQALEVTGSRGSVTLEGEKAMADLLSPGSLRSTLFTLQPLAGGDLLIWGAGTGHGLGLCTAGALGQASLGRSWTEILPHYFPGLVLTDLNAKLKPALAPKTGRYRKPKNPRKKQ